MTFKRYTFKLDLSEDESHHKPSLKKKKKKKKKQNDDAFHHDAFYPEEWQHDFYHEIAALHVPHSEFKSLLEKLSLPTIGNKKDQGDRLAKRLMSSS